MLNKVGYFLSPRAKKVDPKSAVLDEYKKAIKRLNTISSVALLAGLIAIAIGSFALYKSTNKPPVILATTAPTTTALGQTGTLAGINDPLNSTQLSVINNAPDSYFAQAAQMYLNGSIQNQIFAAAPAVKPFNSPNNKTSVIYLGSITCVFCGENRWAMALALSRFGTFSKLFKGYSALQDGDVPTLYWTQTTYTVSNDNLGSFYNSSYINFISIEDTMPITGGFSLNPLSTMKNNIARTNNTQYINAFNFIVNLSANKTIAFQGTPYTIWGKRIFLGADASDFGNIAPSAGQLPIASMTHAQIFQEFSSPHDQFSWTEYAAADVYIAALCSSIKGLTPAICSNSAIQAIQTKFA